MRIVRVMRKWAEARLKKQRGFEPVWQFRH